MKSASVNSSEIRLISPLGRLTLSTLRQGQNFLDFFAETMASLIKPPFFFHEFIKQLHFIANESLFIILISVCFAAMVTLLESSFHMKLVIQNDSLVPGFAALLIIRELGAVVTALLLVSRVGAGIAAEISTMKTTEQIDAFRMLGLDPIVFLVKPRLLASVFGTVLLVGAANVVCIFCAMMISDSLLGQPPAQFLAAMNRFIDFQDLLFSLVKGACFGFVIPIVACYFGFGCKDSSEGVGQATTTSVVAASIAIIFLDFILSYIFTYFY